MKPPRHRRGFGGMQTAPRRGSPAAPGARSAPPSPVFPRPDALPGAVAGGAQLGPGAFLPMMGFWVEAGAADSRRVTAAHSSRPSAYSRCPGLAMAPTASRRLSKALRPGGPERRLRGREAAGGRPTGRGSAAGAYGKCSPGARARRPGSGDGSGGLPGRRGLARRMARPRSATR